MHVSLKPATRQLSSSLKRQWFRQAASSPSWMLSLFSGGSFVFEVCGSDGGTWCHLTVWCSTSSPRSPFGTEQEFESFLNSASSLGTRSNYCWNLCLQKTGFQLAHLCRVPYRSLKTPTILAGLQCYPLVRFPCYLQILQGSPGLTC